MVAEGAVLTHARTHARTRARAHTRACARARAHTHMALSENMVARWLPKELCMRRKAQDMHTPGIHTHRYNEYGPVMMSKFLFGYPNQADSAYISPGLELDQVISALLLYNDIVLMAAYH